MFKYAFVIIFSIVVTVRLQSYDSVIRRLKVFQQKLGCGIEEEVQPRLHDSSMTEIWRQSPGVPLLNTKRTLTNTYDVANSSF